MLLYTFKLARLLGGVIGLGEEYGEKWGDFSPSNSTYKSLLMLISSPSKKFFLGAQVVRKLLSGYGF